MSLTPSNRVKFKTEIARRLSVQPRPEIDITLEEFGAFVDRSWAGNTSEYVLMALREIDDGNLQQLAAHLDIDVGLGGVLDQPSFWGRGNLKVFLSHLSSHKTFASKLQAALAERGISSFVAHEDIEPDAAWQGEILKALKTCDALVALLHPGFNESKWTDQEVGYALGRGITVFAVRLGLDPYGLFGLRQAFNGHGKAEWQIAQELFEAYCSNPQTASAMADVVVDLFVKSGSFEAAKRNCKRVEELTSWKPDYTKRLRDAISTNSQVAYAFGVEDRIEKLIKKWDPNSPASAAMALDEGDEIPF